MVPEGKGAQEKGEEVLEEKVVEGSEVVWGTGVEVGEERL